MTLIEAAYRLPKKNNHEPPEGFEGWIVAELKPKFFGRTEMPWGRFTVGNVRPGEGGKRVYGENLPLACIKRWACIPEADALHIIRSTREPLNELPPASA